MEMIKLQAQTRQSHGTRQARRLRKEGRLPGIVYGHGQTPLPVAVSAEEMDRLLEQHTPMIELAVDGEPVSALIKDVQYDALGAKPVHVDFMRVDVNERVTVSVRLEFKGTPAGMQEGGVFEEQLMDLEIETLAGAIPESIRVNVSDLKLGQFLHVKDLVLPPDVKAVTPGEAIVCTVRAKAEEVEEEAVAAEAGPTQPEIITARKPAEDEGDEK